MKKLLFALSSISFLTKAAEEMESMGSDVSQAMSDMSSKAEEAMLSLGLKARVMMYWASMSFMYKLIILAVVGLAALWIICKLMHCRKGSCSCGCGGNGNCGCHPK